MVQCTIVRAVKGAIHTELILNLPEVDMVYQTTLDMCFLLHQLLESQMFQSVDDLVVSVCFEANIKVSKTSFLFYGYDIP